jgi:hypothetical protein
MRSTANDAAVLRLRQSALNDTVNASQNAQNPGSVSLLVQTTTITTYPTVANAFYACVAVTPTGTEDEGVFPTLTNQGGTFLALGIGTAVPAHGTYLLITHIGGVWVFRYD